MLRSVVKQKLTDVSEVLTTSSSGTHHPGDGGSKHLRNVDKFLLDYMAQHPRRRIFMQYKLNTSFTFHDFYLDELYVLKAG
jgi:hypothetical protein